MLEIAGFAENAMNAAFQGVEKAMPRTRSSLRLKSLL